MVIREEKAMDEFQRQHTGSWNAVGMLVLGAACWGLSFPLMKALLLAQGQAAPGAGLWFLTSQGMMWRFGIGAIVMAAVWPGRLVKATRTEVKLGIGIGVTGGAGMVVQMAGLNDTLASTSSFLTQFYALLIPVVLAIYYRRLPHWLVWISCALVVAGMGKMCGVDWRNFRLGRGEWLTLLASAIFTGQILWLGWEEFRECDKLGATIIMFITIAVMLLPVALLTARQASDLLTVNASLPAVALQVCLISVPAIGGFMLMNTWQPRVTATQAGLAYCAEPVFASLYAMFLPGWLEKLGGFSYPNEHLTGNLLVGGILITIANVLVHYEN